MNKLFKQLITAAFSSAVVYTSSVATAEPLPTLTWPSFQFSAGNNAVFSEPNWQVAWRADVGNRINGGLAIVGDKLYAESFDKKTYAFDATSGAKIWEAAANHIVMTTPVVYGGIVIVGSGIGAEMAGSATQALWGAPDGDAIYGFDASSGALRWRFVTVGEDMSTGVINLDEKGRSRFIFCNGDDHAYALDPATGHLLWKSAISGGCLMSNLDASEGRVYGASGFSWELISGLARRHDQALYRTLWTWSIDPASGSLIWSNSPGSVHGGVTIGDGLVFDEFAVPAAWRNRNAATVDNDEAMRLNVVSAFDQRTGAIKWQYVSSAGPLIQIGSRITEYQGLYNNSALYISLPMPSKYVALDARSGQPRWVIDTQAPVKMTAVTLDGLLYFGDEGGNFYVVRATDGAIQQQIKFPNYFTCSPPVIVGQTLFVENGRSIYALRIHHLADDAARLTAGAPSAPPF